MPNSVRDYEAQVIKLFVDAKLASGKSMSELSEITGLTISQLQQIEVAPLTAPCCNIAMLEAAFGKTFCDNYLRTINRATNEL